MVGWLGWVRGCLPAVQLAAALGRTRITSLTCAPPSRSPIAIARNARPSPSLQRGPATARQPLRPNPLTQILSPGRLACLLQPLPIDALRGIAPTVTLNLEGFELLETYAVVVAECIRANTILERLVVRPSRGELISDSRSNGCGGGGGQENGRDR